MDIGAIITAGLIGASIGLLVGIYRLYISPAIWNFIYQFQNKKNR